MPSPLVIALTAAGFCGLFIGTVIDLRARIIPDQMVLLVLAAGVSARVVADGWFAGWSLLIGFVLFLPLAAATHRGFIGGGDAKMIPAVTLLFEPPRVFGLLLGIAVAGGVLALIYLAAAFLRRPPNPSRGTALQFGAQSQLPYGVAIFVGAVVAVVQEPFPCWFATFCSP